MKQKMKQELNAVWVVEIFIESENKWKPNTLTSPHSPCFDWKKEGLTALKNWRGYYGEYRFRLQKYVSVD